MRENLRIQHNTFKSEIFSLGMVILSILAENEEIVQAVYDFETKLFDIEKFSEIVKSIKD